MKLRYHFLRFVCIQPQLDHLIPVARWPSPNFSVFSSQVCFLRLGLSLSALAHTAYNCLTSNQDEWRRAGRIRAGFPSARPQSREKNRDHQRGRQTDWHRQTPKVGAAREGAREVRRRQGDVASLRVAGWGAFTKARGRRSQGPCLSLHCLRSSFSCTGHFAFLSYALPSTTACFSSLMLSLSISFSHPLSPYSALTHPPSPLSLARSLLSRPLYHFCWMLLSPFMSLFMFLSTSLRLSRLVLFPCTHSLFSSHVILPLFVLFFPYSLFAPSSNEADATAIIRLLPSTIKIATITHAILSLGRSKPDTTGANRDWLPCCPLLTF